MGSREGTVSCRPTTGLAKCSGIAEVVLTTPDPDRAREAQEEAIMLEFLEARGVFSRDPLDFKDKDKNKIDDRVEGGGYSGNPRPESGGGK